MPILRIKPTKSDFNVPKIKFGEKKIEDFIREIRIINFKLGTKFAQRFAEFLIHNNLCFYAVKFLD